MARAPSLSATFLPREQACAAHCVCLQSADRSRWLKTEQDEYFREPSSLFPESARFDTDHVRDTSKAPAHQTIRIAHVFVGFPDPTPAPKQRRRKALTREAIESSVG
jgi:hypothetical protein